MVKIHWWQAPWEVKLYEYQGLWRADAKLSGGTIYPVSFQTSQTTREEAIKVIKEEVEKEREKMDKQYRSYSELSEAREKAEKILI